MDPSILVALVAAVTLVRAVKTGSLFMVACVAAQAFALVGMVISSPACIFIGHVSFSVAVWAGACVLSGFDLHLVGALLVLTLWTRARLGYCLLAQARGSTATKDPVYDLFYAIPLAIAMRRALVEKKRRGYISSDDVRRV